MVKKFIERFYIAIIFILLYSPIVVLVALSFNKSPKSAVVWKGFTLDWYSQLFSDKSIMSALWTTLSLALLSAVIASVLGVAACVGINAMGRHSKGLVLGISNITLLNADIVTGISLMLIFSRLFNIDLGFSTVLISHITFSLPYVILSVMPRLKQTSRSAYEAARDLGANGAFAFLRVVLPDIFPGILSGFLLAFTMSLDDYVITAFTTGNGVQTISTLVYSERRKGISPKLYALSTIMFLFILILLFTVNRISARRESKDAAVVD